MNMHRSGAERAKVKQLMNRLDIHIRRTMGFLSFSHHMAPTQQ